MEIVIKNRQRSIKLSPRRIETLAKRVYKNILSNPPFPGLPSFTAAELSVVFVDDKEMQKLNSAYRGIDATTDVLSFPQEEFGPLHTRKKNTVKDIGKLHGQLGDIVISPAQAKRQAAEYGSTLSQEMAWLMVHGLLHLVGYDHEAGAYQARRMRARERKILEEIGIKRQGL